MMSRKIRFKFKDGLIAESSLGSMVVTGNNVDIIEILTKGKGWVIEHEGKQYIRKRDELQSIEIILN